MHTIDLKEDISFVLIKYENAPFRIGDTVINRIPFSYNFNVDIEMYVCMKSKELTLLGHPGVCTIDIDVPPFEFKEEYTQYDKYTIRLNMVVYDTLYIIPYEDLIEEESFFLISQEYDDNLIKLLSGLVNTVYTLLISTPVKLVFYVDSVSPLTVVERYGVFISLPSIDITNDYALDIIILIVQHIYSTVPSYINRSLYLTESQYINYINGMGSFVHSLYLIRLNNGTVFNGVTN